MPPQVVSAVSYEDMRSSDELEPPLNIYAYTSSANWIKEMGMYDRYLRLRIGSFHDMVSVLGQI